MLYVELHANTGEGLPCEMDMGAAGQQDFPGGSSGKDAACNSRDLDSIPGQEDPLEEGMAIHSRILAWRIPWIEEPGSLQSIGLQKVRHD